MYNRREKMPSRINFETEVELKEALKKACKPKCKKCFGRGHTGYYTLKKIWRRCQCVDTNLLKSIHDESEVKKNAKTD